MVDLTASLDAATQQILALLAQIRFSNVRAIQAQDIGAADAYVFAPIPNVTGYGADLVLVADIAAPNLTTTPKLTIQGLATIPIQAADGSTPAIGAVAGKRLIGFSSVGGGGFVARLLGLAPADFANNQAAQQQFAPVNRVKRFTASGWYTVPPANQPDGTTTIDVDLQAPGGPGGCSGNGTGGGVAGNIGAGGGGGGAGSRTITGLVPGTQYYVTIGAPGQGVANVSGTAGGTTSFGPFISATGGGAGATGNYTVGGGGAAGTVTGADRAWSGGTGGFAGSNSSTVTTSDVSRVYGRGGWSRYGFVDLAQTGATGNGFGAGGTGASGGSGLAGGNGAPAFVDVRN